MALTYSPKIVTDGLVLCLDAKQNSSFPSITLPVKDGLILWLDAADDNVFNYSSGTAVSQWRDKSGLNNHVNQTNTTYQPERSTSTNGKKTILFSSDYLITDSNILKAYTSYTKIAVVKQTSTSTNGNIIGKSTGANTTFWYGASNSIRLYHNSATILTSSIATTLNTWNILSGSFDSVLLNANIYVNGSSGGSATSPTVTQITTDSDVEIGGFNGAGYYFTGEISEILIFNRVLSTTELKQVHTYLGQKWGISNNDKIWCDLSGNNNHATIVGSVSHSNGIFTLPGTSGSYIEQLSLNLSTTNHTIIGASRYVTVGGRVFSGGANNWLMGHWTTSTVKYYANGWVTSTTNNEQSDTNWRIYAAIGNYTSDLWSFYVNGSIHTVANSGGTNGPNGFIIGRRYETDSEYSNSQVAFLLAYNRILSSSEILQNYNAMKGRFNL
jgi:hypothetical protein